MSSEPEPLYRTGTGGRRHIRACPHVIGKDVVEATDAQGEICTICQRELAGEGRRYFASLQDALHDFGAARANWPLIHEHLAGITHDQVWIVNSGSYIALGRAGRAVAWAGKTYVNPSADTLVELPDYRAGGGGGAPVRDTWGETCEKHFVTRSRSGACERCDD